MKRSAIILVIFLFAYAFLFAQNEPSISPPTGEFGSPFQIASSSTDYPVTPGDIYRLSYHQASDVLIVWDVTVDSDYLIDLNVFGKIDGTAYTFLKLKRKVEEQISASYTRSMPSLTLVAPGTFQVIIKGDIPRQQNIAAWGMSRLGEILEQVKDINMNVRLVEVTSRKGDKKTYDLFKAMRSEGANEPYMKAGDSITIRVADKSVRIDGEVRLPGTYTLLQNEGFKELINTFAGGFRTEIKETDIQIDRIASNGIFSSYESLAKALESKDTITNGDQVYVRKKSGISFTALPSTVRVAGAVLEPGQFPYQPGLPALSYIAQAGGTNPELNSGDAFLLTDVNGKHKSTDGKIAPGDRIYVRSNTLNYTISQIAPVLSFLTTVITSVLLVYTTIGSFTQ